MAGANQRALERDDAAAFQEAAEDRGGEVAVVQRGNPVGERLVGREDDRAALDVALVDEVEEQQVGGRAAVAEIAEFVDEQDRGGRRS